MPKVIELIHSLTAAEGFEFVSTLNGGKSGKSLNHLFNLLRAHQGDWLEEHKKAVFEKLYRRPYKANKDYLLRGMFRNLSAKLDDFLEAKAVYQELKNNLNLQNYFLLKSYEDRKLYRLFDLNYSKAIEKAEESMDYMIAGALCHLAYNHVLLHGIPDEKTTDTLQHLQEKQFSFLSALFLQKNFSTLLYKPGFPVHNTPNGGAAIDFLPTSVLTQSCADYWALKIQIFQNKEGRIPLIRQCLQLLDENCPAIEQYEKERLFCEAVLALELATVGEYEAALNIYNTLLQHLDDLPKTVALPLICDYLITLLHVKNYREVSEKASKFKARMAEYPHYEMRLNIILAMSYAFRQDAGALRETLPQQTQNLPEFLKNFFRFLFAIQFYLEGNYNLALREMDNFLQKLRKMADPESAEKPIAAFFKRFFYLFDKYEADREEALTYLEKLQHEMIEYQLSAPEDLMDYLPFYWLQQELAEQVAEVRGLVLVEEN
ncbi:MAG TPA: hypothetical protein PKA00_01105 [Saprospiraceae bacterium]|nr:hypothetical protein [Saprospiraceae bacterium]HMQ81465.1 hypothetical protein [Saprospiraceae bacterium]